MFKKIYLERSGCYGACPIYSVEVNRDGRLKWIGEMFVSYVGETSYQVSNKKLQKLERLLKEFDYRNYKKECGGLFATDQSNCITRVEFVDGFVKEIDHYLGEMDETPNDAKYSMKNLEKFEQKLESIMGVRQLVRQTLYLYHLFAVKDGLEAIVSAPNQKSAKRLIDGKQTFEIKKIGKDTTEALHPYVVLKK
ncbi:hypothetical protein SAMN05216389_106171 [Oceanobacillus limi]|uniref:DUF6438 domain-containing protein n=1 Tax=Oceanobacillus limi TaxID=930131 RepID=A0A1I0CEH5_9BACI|nr:DUF6438 domain-containing protein [Oceanobacillus limi]SET17506.1 hypothetical protein SAMN05216389_106171 [Oceanobacillus limi]